MKKVGLKLSRLAGMLGHITQDGTELGEIAQTLAVVDGLYPDMVRLASDYSSRHNAIFQAAGLFAA